MPIIERDPWRTQYFEGVPCPDDVAIPTDDGDAYELYPAHRWVYNKLLICESQGLAHAPHGLLPPMFPVFSKPIYNLKGMGTGSAVIPSPEAYERMQQPGHMWMPLLTGEHLSTDVAVRDGDPLWWRHARGRALGDGLFDYWTILAEPRPRVEAYLAAWVGKYLRGYRGIVNFETIEGTIIECHLRMSDQWVDLYGHGWIAHVVSLYTGHRWAFQDRDRRTGYSVVLFGDHGVRYPTIDPGLLTACLSQREISSVQIPFHHGKAPELHAMPPGGFRLAIVNCWDLEAGMRVRNRLREAFRGHRPAPGAAPSVPRPQVAGGVV